MDSSVTMDALQQLGKLSVVGPGHVRSEGPHVSGLLTDGRLFGGQTVAQAYLAVRKLLPQHQVLKLETQFAAPGNTHESLDFLVDPRHVTADVTRVRVRQGAKAVASVTVRLGSTPWQLLHAPFPAHVLPPLHYAALEVGEHATNFFARLKNQICEVRPVDEEHYAMMRDSLQPTQFWGRLNRELGPVAVEDPVAAVLLLSDYLIFHPVMLLFIHYGRVNEAAAGASLDHCVYIHHTDIDPTDYFLFENRSRTSAHNCSIIDGRIFDTKKRCIISYRQQNYLTRT